MSADSTTAAIDALDQSELSGRKLQVRPARA
jgi:hypothetical protein